MKVASHRLINQTSGKTEYYTPQNIIEAARYTLGRIELDPASSARANLAVKAEAIFTSGGLQVRWFGRVWLNHPFSRKENKQWIDKLVFEFMKGHVHSACCITFAATSEQWFQPLLNFPQCFLCPRTNYILPDGKTLRGVTKGSVVTYLGQNIGAFQQGFEKLGKIKI